MQRDEIINSEGMPKSLAQRLVGLGNRAAGIAANIPGTQLAAANYIVNQITRPNPWNFMETYNFTPFETGVDWEAVRFPGPGGRMLDGWWYLRPETRRVVVTVAGNRGSKTDMLGISSYLWRAGFNVFSFDCRGAGIGRQPGEINTLGHNEAADYQAALDYVRQRRPDALIGLCGASLGAATTLVVAANNDDVLAVWSDSAFASRRDVVAVNFEQTAHIPAKLVMDKTDEVFFKRTGQHLDDFRPEDAVAKMKPRPIYFLHGGQDKIVPLSHVHRLYGAATGPKELWIEPEVEHCGIYFLDRPKCCRITAEFFGQYLVENAPPKSEVFEQVAQGG